MANITLQHLLVSTDNWVGILGGKAKEMAQESFNCLSAAIILVVDECVDNMNMIGIDKKTTQSAKSTFNALLHLLCTPQSSVTLLRTLGGE